MKKSHSTPLDAMRVRILVVAACVALLAFAASELGGGLLFGDGTPAPADLPQFTSVELVAGEDANGDGIRDEVEALLVVMFPDDAQRQPWLAYAKALQLGARTIESTPPAEVASRYVSVMRALACLQPNQEGAEDSSEKALQVRVLTLDTPLRREGWDMLEARASDLGIRVGAAVCPSFAPAS